MEGLAWIVQVGPVSSQRSLQGGQQEGQGQRENRERLEDTTRLALKMEEGP